MSKPGTRRDGREAAVQYLFGHESLGEAETDQEHFALFWSLRDAREPVRQFAESLIRGIRRHQDEIDAIIADCLENFTMDRLLAVDRNILRLGIYEMFYNLDVPPVVAINEAIEVAKKFGGEDSGRFVNGLLDKVKGEVTRPLREARPRQRQGTADSAPATI